jgi:hypothetical protein
LDCNVFRLATREVLQRNWTKVFVRERFWCLVVDRLPANAWLTDLGTHALRDLPRPERVVQLCHPDLRNDFPPLRAADDVVAHGLPAQLTSFVGREAQISDARKLMASNRLVTLTGAGGVGKTRLAVQVAAELADQFGDGVWYVDLAPITHPAVVPVTVNAAAKSLVVASSSR